MNPVLHSSTNTAGMAAIRTDRDGRVRDMMERGVRGWNGDVSGRSVSADPTDGLH
jgi:hypothetical protein